MPTPSRPAIPLRSGTSAARRHLLLIDDELAIARFIAHAAEDCGFEAIVTVTAESFRSQYKALDPAVVVMDLALPRSDGVELLRFLAEDKCEALVVLISGFDERVLEAAMRLGLSMGLRMSRPLTKPVRLQELTDAINGETEVCDVACER
jgi:DNA-binding response OmpR family regulator